MSIMSVLKRVWGLLSGTGFLWKLARNYRVLSDSFGAIEKVLLQMRGDNRKLPSQEQSIVLLQAISNILKTGVIDIPGVDEIEISIGIDQITQQMAIGIKDAKSGKFHEFPILKGG